MWSEIVYKLFYLLLHFLYTFIERVAYVLRYIVQIVIQFCHEFLPTMDKNKQIRNQFSEISKTPVHLTVLLGHEEPSYKDLSNLIIWCLATRIPFISFYDYKGVLKKNEEKFQQEVSIKKPKEDHVFWHDGSGVVYKNGFSGRKIHVKVLTADDGRNSVVQFAKNISLTKNRDFVIEHVNEVLSKQYEFPDPDLGLVCGQTFSFYNYPPWQTRVTEFFVLDSHYNITFSCFLKQLVLFSRCEQRYGK